jgi:uncharacterized protein YndB with AHSA1/START domain/predicted enzyme related to lactoylglutathione lyase
MAQSLRKVRAAPSGSLTLFDTALLMKRRLPAPQAAVFEAWTDPQHVRLWFCPVGFEVVVAEVDLRPGGAYRIGMRSPEGKVATTHGVFREIQAPERLVYTWRWEDPGALETLVTVEFHDRGPETELVLRHERFADAARRDNHLQGWQGCLQNLDLFLSARAEARPEKGMRSGTAKPGRAAAAKGAVVAKRKSLSGRKSSSRRSAMAHEFNHIELQSTAVAKSETFYKKLFGWKVQPMPDMHYALFTAGKGPGGGMAQLDKKQGPSHWIPYVRVTSIRTSIRKAKALGAKVLMDVVKIPGYGQIAVLKDPSGAPIGLSQPAR